MSYTTRIKSCLNGHLSITPSSTKTCQMIDGLAQRIKSFCFHILRIKTHLSSSTLKLKTWLCFCFVNILTEFLNLKSLLIILKVICTRNYIYVGATFLQFYILISIPFCLFIKRIQIRAFRCMRQRHHESDFICVAF